MGWRSVEYLKQFPLQPEGQYVAIATEHGVGVTFVGHREGGGRCVVIEATAGPVDLHMYVESLVAQFQMVQVLPLPSLRDFS